MTYGEQSKEERSWLERARKILPGGTLGNVRLPDEYAFVVERGKGSHVWDLSGNEYIDYLLSSGPMILGHSHPDVVQATQAALLKGSSFFTQNTYAIELAEQIVQAVPCAEQVRFTSTGTEATLQCLRLARAYTGRQTILKFEGGFHGMHDYSLMSLSPSGTVPFPYPEPSSAGIPKAVESTVLVAPFNDLGYATSIIEEKHEEIAAVILEPVQRVIAPADGFLAGIRELCDKYGIVLIFDEIVTGFRLAYGGAQEAYGVTPDLAALGKIVGGGFPLAAIAGGKDLLEAYDATAVPQTGFIPLIGTLSGNPVACAAGLATLQILRDPGRYTSYWETGARLRNGLQSLLDHAEIPAVVSGVDVMFDVYFTDGQIENYRDTLVDKSINAIFDQALMKRGVFKSAGKIYVGMCHTEGDVQATLEAFSDAVGLIAEH